MSINYILSVLSSVSKELILLVWAIENFCDFYIYFNWFLFCTPEHFCNHIARIIHNKKFFQDSISWRHVVFSPFDHYIPELLDYRGNQNMTVSCSVLYSTIRIDPHLVTISCRSRKQENRLCFRFYWKINMAETTSTEIYNSKFELSLNVFDFNILILQKCFMCDWQIRINRVFVDLMFAQIVIIGITGDAVDCKED